MDVKFINRYKKKTIPQLIKIADRHFNTCIRNRDANKSCISCNSANFTDAGHFYPAGHYPALRYNENNVHGQCASCNRFKHGNLHEYRKKLETRIGAENLKDLDNLSDIYKRSGWKWSKMDLIDKIYTYQQKNKAFKC
jgi:gamma-glutamylcyclotransferase (GGCT)/AIG2-like uncharacterized protein YtfP